jgi:hypothetical protein
LLSEELNEFQTIDICRHGGRPGRIVILFPPELHRRLTQIAAERRTSMADLVRRACEREYGSGGASREERLAAVRRMASLNLPVCDIEQMERESVPDPNSFAP